MNIFAPNSRVTFLGDSITAANNHVSRIADYYRKNLPSLGVKFYNAGVSGGSVGSSELFMKDDLDPTKPDYVIIMLGVNDSNRGALDIADASERDRRLNEAFDRYKIGMNRMVDGLTARQIQVILCTPAPYGEHFVTEQRPLPGGHALILRYARCIREMAAKKNLPLVDFHTYLSELYLDEPLYNADHVHPNDAGHVRMAECFLLAQGLPITPAPIGFTPEPISPEMDEWRTYVSKVRRIYANEWMTIHSYSSTFEEKMAIVYDYVEKKKWGTFLYFETIIKEYIEDKPHEAELVAKINGIMDRFYCL